MIHHFMNDITIIVKWVLISFTATAIYFDNGIGTK